MRFLRKLFLDRNKLVHREDGYWDAHNFWYGVSVCRFDTKEEALRELNEGIEAKKAYSEAFHRKGE